MIYQRFIPSGCKYKGIGKFEFCGKDKITLFKFNCKNYKNECKTINIKLCLRIETNYLPQTKIF